MFSGVSLVGFIKGDIQVKILLSYIMILSNIAWAWNGVGIRKQPKHPKDIAFLPYVNPKAPKGGRIEIGREGTFDSLNPYAAKGIPALLLNHLVFQTLGQSVLDDPGVNYPSIGKSFKVSKDQLSFEVELWEDAKFSDGHPITSKDVEFSLKLFQSDKIEPWYRTYWQDIKNLEIISDHKIKFHFKKVNPELAMITMELPILPMHVYSKGDFGREFAGKAVGSGPYVVKDFQSGSMIVYERNKNFWGNEKPFFKGLFNIDEIVVTYYRDSTALVEGLKKGEFDMYVCHNSRIWANELDGASFDKGWVKKHEWKHQNSQGSQAFHWNLQKEIFKDVKVRKALALAFDFEWTNKTLFYGQYKENASYFENSELAARGLPSSEEKSILMELQKKHPKAVTEETWSKPMGFLGKGLTIRKRLRQAQDLLKSAGYQVKDGALIGPNGKLEFTVLLSSPAMARIIEPWAKNLKRLGVVAEIDVKDRSVYQRRVQDRNFDVIVYRLGQSLSPGNEQKGFWHSESADIRYSRNVMGLKNPAVDEVVEKLIYAPTRKELLLYTHVLDRLLYHTHMAVQNWHIDYERVVLWSQFRWPEKMPDHFTPLHYLDVMWVDPKQAKKVHKFRTES